MPCGCWLGWARGSAGSRWGAERNGLRAPSPHQRPHLETLTLSGSLATQLPFGVLPLLPSRGPFKPRAGSGSQLVAPGTALS